MQNQKLDTLRYPVFSPSNDQELIGKSSTQHIFEDVIHDLLWASFSWQGFRLVGQSDPYRICGKWGINGCLNHQLHKGRGNYFQPYVKTCYRPSCSKCVEAWANREANRATRRHLKRMKKGGKPSHVVFSPPAHSISWKYETIDKEFKKISREIGVTGASVVFHPARFHNKKMIPYASPHFHTIAYGWFDGKKIAKVYEEKGWTVKKIRTIKNEGEIFATIKYILSHAGLKQKIIEKNGKNQLRSCHTLRWMGDVSYRKLPIDKEEKEEQNCPECSGELQRLRLRNGFSRDGKPPPPKDLVGFHHCNAFEVVNTGEKSSYYDDLWNLVKEESVLEKEAVLEASITGKRTSYYCHKLESFLIKRI